MVRFANLNDVVLEVVLLESLEAPLSPPLRLRLVRRQRRHDLTAGKGVHGKAAEVIEVCCISGSNSVGSLLSENSTHPGVRSQELLVEGATLNSDY